MYQHLFTDGARLAEIDIWMFTKAFGNDERLRSFRKCLPFASILVSSSVVARLQCKV